MYFILAGLKKNLTPCHDQTQGFGVGFFLTLQVTTVVPSKNVSFQNHLKNSIKLSVGKKKLKKFNISHTLSPKKIPKSLSLNHTH
jgi:hypothetical protein